MGAYYIVTDLVVRARFDVEPLHLELRSAGLHGQVTHWDNVWRADYATSKRCCRHPSEAVEELVGIVEALTAEGRDLWDRCISRRFDMGYVTFDERLCSKWQLKAGLLQRLANINGDLVITVYDGDQREEARRLSSDSPRPVLRPE